MIYTTKIKVICEQCGKEFFVYKSRIGKSRFCSHKCYSKWTSDNKSGKNSPCYKGRIKLICEQCGKEFSVHKSHVERRRFCCMKCKGEWQSENKSGKNSPNWKGGDILSICWQCKKKYYITPANKEKSHFCSYKCRSEWISKNKSDKNSSLYIGYIISICEQCGKEYEVHPYREDITNFCSKECMYQWMSQSSEFKRKISASHQGILYDEWENFAVNSLYCPDFNEECKESNREKYGRRCFLTGLSEEDNITSTGKHQKLSVHHVDMDKGQGCNGKRWKLVPLSLNQHHKVHNELWGVRIIWLLDNVWNNEDYLW